MPDYAKLRKRTVARVDVEHDGEAFTFHMRSLTAREFWEWSTAYIRNNALDPEGIPALVALSLCDEDGNAAFANAEEGTAEVASWNAAVVKSLSDVAFDLNAMSLNEKKAMTIAKPGSSSTTWRGT